MENSSNKFSFKKRKTNIHVIQFFISFFKQQNENFIIEFMDNFLRVIYTALEN